MTAVVDGYQQLSDNVISINLKYQKKQRGASIAPRSGYLQGRLLDFGISSGELGRGLLDLAQDDDGMGRAIDGEIPDFLQL